MNGVSVSFLLVMIVAGGLIAYAGDFLGRKIGKNKLRVWKLRPKNTAAVGTFIAGMIGTILTVALLAVFSEPVRAWLVEGEQVRKDLIKSRAELDKAQANLMAEQKRYSELEKNNSQLAGENEAKQEEIRIKDGEIYNKEGKIKSLEGQMSGLRTSMSDFKGRLDSARKTVSTLTSQQKDLEEEVKKQERQKSATQAENAEFQKVNANLIQANTDLEVKIQNAEKEANQLSNDINEYKQLIENQKKQLSENDEKYKEEIKKAEASIAQSENLLKELTQDIESLKSARSLLESTIGVARINPLLFNRGQELSRIQLRDRLSKAEALGNLQRLLTLSSDEAKGAGSSRDANGNFAALVSRNVGNQVLSAEEQLDLASNQMSGQTEHLLIITRVLYNAFLDEPVAVTLEIHKNPIVFSEGDVVMEIRVDGRDSENEVIDDILNQLRSGLRARAVDRGMIPALGKANEIGEVSQDQILDMAQEITSRNRVVTVQLLATKETRAGDKLTLDFRIR